MGFIEFLRQNWFEVFVLTREHLLLVLLSTLSAVVIGVPLGIVLTRFEKLKAPVLGIANVLQTVPSLAIFGLLIPLPFIGGIGARTAVIALVLYSLLPIIRNTVTGILNVDPNVREAALAMGLTDRQILRMVELPLAAPVILTGIRVAVVIAVGVATIAAAVGAGGLGTYIFRGLRQNDNNLLLAGALFSAFLALFADFGLGRIERAFPVGERVSGARRRTSLTLAAIALAIITGLIIWPGPGASNGSRELIRVGSKDFTESIILAEILAQMLENRGLAVERQFELGGNLAHDSVVSGRIDVYPEYTGTAFTAILKNAPITDPEKVYRQTREQYLERFKLGISPPLGFSNDFAILIRGEDARRLSIKTISEALPFSKQWQAGFGQDFMSRADGYAGFAKAYDLQFSKQPREMDLSLTYRALASNQVDIIAGNSTDGLITALDLFQLADDKKYFPPYQAVFIIRDDKSEVLRETLGKLEDSISTDEMRRLNFETDGNGRAPKEVVAEWLKNKGF